MEAYPLQWPQGWPETEPHQRERSRFKLTPDRARRNLLYEIGHLVGTHNYWREDIIISTDVRLRQDGEPYAGQRPPENPGVAVYFPYGDRNMVFACDRWDLVHDNIHAIGKTIEALRGIERWGASDMLERAFTGFLALEHQEEGLWETILQMGSREGASDADWMARAESNYKIIRSDAHPDSPTGSVDDFHRVQIAIEQARQALTK